MTFVSRTVALSCVGVLLSASVAFAQVGGAEVPSNAKTGMSSGHQSSMMMHKRTMRKGTMMRSRGKMPGHKTF